MEARFCLASRPDPFERMNSTRRYMGKGMATNSELVGRTSLPFARFLGTMDQDEDDLGEDDYAEDGAPEEDHGWGDDGQELRPPAKKGRN